MKQKKKKHLISIIIACYNTEKYVKRCLDSIFSQTQRDIQVIIIEDHSTDNTRKVLKKYLLSVDSKNVIYIENSKNFGLAKSRNIGLEKADGEYIGFIDSDDYIPENYYEELYGAIIRDKSDIAIADMNIIYENENNKKVLSKIIGGEKTRENFINSGLAASACNKLIRKDLIIKYPFPEGKLNEDVAVIIPCMIYAKNISYVETTQYNYIQHSNSIQNASISYKRLDIFDMVDLCLERIKENKFYEKYKEIIIYQQIVAFLLYAIPREKSFIRRNKILRKFSLLSKKYKLINNKKVIEFISEQGKKHRYYYNAIFKLNDKNLYYLINLLISIYRIYSIFFIKRVIKKDININDLIFYAKKQKKMKEDKLKISVVVPNYNYEKFLFQRIYSILKQNKKIYELIILDDFSSDNSRKAIDYIVEKLSPYIDVKKEYNNTNSGSAFNQWQKGFNLSKGDYVWIAEADDYSDPKFLKNVTRPIYKNKDIMISYSDTAIIDSTGKIVYKSIKPEIDIMKTNHWGKSYINSGKDEINNYSYLNCTISNVSSTLIKKDNYDEFFELSKKYKQSGDWIFYVNVMNRGKIAYCNKVLNYYRTHGNNISTLTNKKDHMNEIKDIHKYFDKKFNLNKKQKSEIQKRYDFLIKTWNLK